MNKKKKKITAALATGIISSATILGTVAQACGENTEISGLYTDPTFFVKYLPAYWGDAEANRSTEENEIGNQRRSNYQRLVRDILDLNIHTQRTPTASASRGNASSSTMIDAIATDGTASAENGPERVAISSRNTSATINLINAIRDINVLLGVFPSYNRTSGAIMTPNDIDYDGDNENENFQIRFSNADTSSMRIQTLRNNIARFIESFSVLLGLNYMKYNIRTSPEGWTSFFQTLNSGSFQISELIDSIFRSIDLVTGGQQIDPSFNESSLLNLASYSANDVFSSGVLNSGLRYDMVSTFRENSSQGGISNDIDPINNPRIEYQDLDQILYLYNPFLVTDLRDESLLNVRVDVTGDASNGSEIIINIENVENPDFPITIMQMQGQVSNIPAASDVSASTPGEGMILDRITMISSDTSIGSLTFSGDNN